MDGALKLVALTPADVYARWDWMRAGLLHTLAKAGGRYRPEDVYLRLRSDSAWAYAIDDDIGFAVLTREFDADGLVLFVWVLWAPPFALRGREDEAYAELERIARECKAKRIRMQSPRAGWAREGFFDRIAVVYEHEVT